MRKFRFLPAVYLTALVLLFNACSGDETKTENTGTDSTKSDSGTVKHDPPMMNSSGPMSIMSVKHKVANYGKWLVAYEYHDSAREANGLHKYVIARGVDDSNMVLVAMKMDDVEKAKAMATSNDMKATMQKAGIVGAPVITYSEMVMNDTTAIQSTVRVMVKHKVKDWDAWKKVFDDHKQARTDAGITDRVVGHDVADNHNVTIVLAVSDVEKAKAFFNSDDLKNRMKDGGVEGKPDFFWYRIVKKY